MCCLQSIRKGRGWTVITNEIIDQGGSTCLNRLVQKTGCPLPQAAEAYLVFDSMLGGRELRQAIRILEPRLAAPTQYRLLLDLENTIVALGEWALERGMQATVEEAVVAGYREQAGNYQKALGGLLPEAVWQSCKETVTALVENGFDENLARRLAVLPQFADFLQLVELARTRDGDLYSVALTLGEIRETLGLRSLLEDLGTVPVRDRWDRLARQSLESAFALGAFGLAAAVLAEADGNLERFLSRRRLRFRNYQGLRESLRGTVPANFHPFTVLVQALEALREVFK
jgi:glutamate dehydrogenase